MPWLANTRAAVSGMAASAAAMAGKWRAAQRRRSFYD